MLVGSEFRDTEMRDGGRQERLMGGGVVLDPFVWGKRARSGGLSHGWPWPEPCRCPAGVQAGIQVSVAPLVEVMRGETVTLDCTPLGDYNQYLLKWFLVSASGWGQGGPGGGF